ncbi:MAG: DegT/DnrJ/EryC1/StrS family aminotransferase [Candidatus Margulisiibacteriota bacterium]
MSQKLWRVGKEELAYIEQAIAGGLTGELTKLLETRFAEKFGVGYAISVNSGTSALHCAMAALDIGAGDEVIVPPLTFAATAFAPLYVGAVPVFADVDPDTFLIDPAEIRRKINPKTKAIIPVSLYGLPPQMDEIMSIAEEYGLKVIEDNAQCFLGKCQGKLAGTYGDFSIFSFQRSKHMTTGDGGIIITDNEELALKARKIADLGYTTLTAKPISNENFKERIQSPNFKRHEFLGYNFRLPEVCAAMAVAQLEKLDMLVEKRIAIGRLYEEALQGCDWLIPQKTPKGIKHSYWTYVLRLDTSKKQVSWSDFRASFLYNGGQPFYGAWSINYLEPAFYGMEFPEHGIRYSKGLCPVAESIQPYLIQLKTNFESLDYGKKQAEALAKTLKDFIT